MDATRKTSFSLEAFLKRSWPYLVAGIVLILGLSGYLIHVALKTKPSATTDDVPVASASSTTDGSATSTMLVSRFLDGTKVAPDQANLQPYAVMVENSPDARPLSGVAEANLVIEAPVEGGITRFMLVFDATTTVDQIGPVRSARPYFVEFADALKAVYAHVGGSADALSNISQMSKFRNLDEMANGKFFWRSAKRLAPHNAYTRTDLLQQADQAKSWTTATFTPWTYLDQPTTSTDFGTVAQVSVPYGGTFSDAWTFDPTTDSYARYQAGTRQQDADGAAVSAKNIVVILTEEKVLDDHGRLQVRTTGSGKAMLFRDGQQQEVTWHRATGEWFRFESIDGSDVLFEPGKTWMSIVTSPSEFPGSPSFTPPSTTSSTVNGTTATSTTSAPPTQPNGTGWSF